MISPPLTEIWVYLSATPLLWLALTLLAYLAAFALLHRRLHFNPLANPVLIAVVLLVSPCISPGRLTDVILTARSSLHFLLGPATVALAVPLYANWSVSRRWPCRCSQRWSPDRFARRCRPT